MGHDHHVHPHNSEKNLSAAFFLNLTFSIIEIVGGLLTNSLSILSDALHDLGDSISLGLAWYLQRISKKGRDEKFTYGYQRFSLLGAVINSIVLFSGGLFVLVFAIPRAMHPEETNASGMIILAILGLVFNSLAYFKLNHGHSHNEKVISLHFMEDILGWLAVLIGSVVIYFTGWYQIDSLLSIGIALYILFNVIKSIGSIWKIILQGIPDHLALNKIKDCIQEIEGIRSFHDLHIWSMDGINCILTVHLVVDQDLSSPVLKKIKFELHNRMSKFKIDHCTVEFENPEDPCDLEYH